MDRKTLIEKYLNADATPGEERQLSESFSTNPPENPEEEAIFAMLKAIKPIETPALAAEYAGFDSEEGGMESSQMETEAAFDSAEWESDLPEEELDRIEKAYAAEKEHAAEKALTVRIWGFSLGGLAAAIAAMVIFIGKPTASEKPSIPPFDQVDLIEQLAFLSNFDPSEAEQLEFKPVGDGFVMTAHFPDGESASFLLTPLDGGQSFNLVSLNQ